MHNNNFYCSSNFHLKYEFSFELPWTRLPYIYFVGFVQKHIFIITHHNNVSITNANESRLTTPALNNILHLCNSFRGISRSMIKQIAIFINRNYNLQLFLFSILANFNYFLIIITFVKSNEISLVKVKFQLKQNRTRSSLFQTENYQQAVWVFKQKQISSHSKILKKHYWTLDLMLHIIFFSILIPQFTLF